MKKWQMIRYTTMYYVFMILWAMVVVTVYTYGKWIDFQNQPEYIRITHPKSELIFFLLLYWSLALFVSLMFIRKDLRVCEPPSLPESS